MADAALLVLISFVSGSLPFSVWLGRLLLRKDVRRFGDGNPGMTNVFRAGGRLLAVVVLMLDVAKAAAPVGCAYHTLGIRGGAMFLVALAPIVGHAFSPFLRFRGGKALAATLGVWIGMTLWPVPLAAVLGVVWWGALLAPTGWAVMLALAGMLATVLVWLSDQLLVSILIGNAILLAWTHRSELRQWPHPTAGPVRLLGWRDG